MKRNLDAEKTIGTIEVLHRRIMERFPSSALSGVCEELCVIAKETQARSQRIARPSYWLRLIVAAVVLAGVAGLVYSIAGMEIRLSGLDLAELVQITDAGLNTLVLIGAAIFFLISFEVRLKRSRALAALHELRSVAHVIDMHQLTKDPSRLRATAVLTPSSPRQDFTPFELTRYLDYASEMLSLTGKIAALYAQDFPDAVVVSAVTEIETLTTGLSRKIWQKIVIIDRLSDETGRTHPAAS